MVRISSETAFTSSVALAVPERQLSASPIKGPGQYQPRRRQHAGARHQDAQRIERPQAPREPFASELLRPRGEQRPGPDKRPDLLGGLDQRVTDPVGRHALIIQLTEVGAVVFDGANLPPGFRLKAESAELADRLSVEVGKRRCRRCVRRAAVQETAGFLIRADWLHGGRVVGPEAAPQSAVTAGARGYA